MTSLLSWSLFSLAMPLMLMTSVNELTTLHMPLAPLSFARNNQKPPKYCRNKFLVTESGGSIQLTWFFFIYVNYHVLLRSSPSIHMRNSVRLSPMTTGLVSRVTISAHIFRSSPVWTDSADVKQRKVAEKSRVFPSRLSASTFHVTKNGSRAEDHFELLGGCCCRSAIESYKDVFIKNGRK